MSAVEPSPPFTPNTTYLTKPATPTLVSVAGWVLLAIAVGWLVLIGYTGFVYATTQLSHLSTWRAQSLVDAQAYYPVLFLMVSAFSNVALHGFCTVAYLRGYRCGVGAVSSVGFGRAGFFADYAGGRSSFRYSEWCSEPGC